MITSAHACMMNIIMTVVFEIKMIIVLKIELNIVIHNICLQQNMMPKRRMSPRSSGNLFGPGKRCRSLSAPSSSMALYILLMSAMRAMRCNLKHRRTLIRGG